MDSNNIIEDEIEYYKNLIKRDQLNVLKQEIKIYQDWDKIMKKYVSNNFKSKRKFKKEIKNFIKIKNI